MNNYDKSRNPEFSRARQEYAKTKLREFPAHERENLLSHAGKLSKINQMGEGGLAELLMVLGTYCNQNDILTNVKEK